MNTVLSSAEPSANPYVRPFHNSMGQAVAERTVLRPILNGVVSGSVITLNPKQPMLHKWAAAAYYAGADVGLSDQAPIRDGLPDARWETWGEVAKRVGWGNCSLTNAYLFEEIENFYEEAGELERHIAKGVLLMSGRHLQHGDWTQPDRNLEVFSNCSTATTSFMEFMLLLNGSGVGRDYSDSLMVVNWDYSPSLRIVISADHADFDYRTDEDARDARHKYVGADVMWHQVEDSREGWAKAVEIYEVAAFEKVHRDKMLVLDFSKVRPKGSPIKGMQYRPSSGPKPLMNALQKVASLKGAGMPMWMQAMYVDHYLAECVLVGGARRAARMATKYWKDKDILEFIRIKRPIEYQGLKPDEVISLRNQRIADGLPPLNSFLWSANNSVLVDEEFWQLVDAGETKMDDTAAKTKYSMQQWVPAYQIWKTLTDCAYADGTGEPGIINVDKLVTKNDGLTALLKTDYVGSAKYEVAEETRLMLSKIGRKLVKMPYTMIVNPCGEVTIAATGGYCVIADGVPFHADTLSEAEQALKAAARALIRVNLMDSLYAKEVKRTNRIGVSLTGVHEFAWKFFKVGFRDLINPDFYAPAYAPTPEELRKHPDPRIRSAAFWRTLSEFSNAVVDEAKAFAAKLKMVEPHTALTVKPAGTTSKLFGLTEGWHLPSMREYIRWVQFRHDDPLVAEYRAKGYPIRELVKYEGTTIVGFPTKPTICTLGMPDDILVTAAEATPEEQYKWLKLGERFWINGEKPNGSTHGMGNQISYTLKYDPQHLTLEEFQKVLRDNQRNIRCCSVMPQADVAAYEYQPEQGVSKIEFEAIQRAISDQIAEDVGLEHVDCSTGACPVDFRQEKAA